MVIEGYLQGVGCFCFSAGDSAVHSLFLASIEAGGCVYEPDDSKLKIIVSSYIMRNK
jgi:hypothetical protein